jgi:hypothetical protein
VAALTGVGVGGAIGGITGALIGMGIPEYEAKRYEGPVKEVASCCPSTPTIPIGPAKLKTFSSALAQMIFRRLAKPVPTSRRQTNQCSAQANIVTHMDLYPRLEGGLFCATSTPATWTIFGSGAVVAYDNMRGLITSKRRCKSLPAQLLNELPKDLQVPDAFSTTFARQCSRPRDEVHAVEGTLE